VDFELQRRQLLAAALSLVDKGLVARTWGNMSVRLDANRFLITPSGIPYEELAIEDLSVVDLATLEYTGRLKPSSEKGLHAAVYGLRPSVMAIVHTHQSWASAVAAARRDLPARSDGAAALDGSIVPCARYALPTTKALVASVVETLKGSAGSVAPNAVLLANHGALCFGLSMEHAVLEAELLEARARDFVLDSFATSASTPAKASVPGASDFKKAGSPSATSPGTGVGAFEFLAREGELIDWFATAGAGR